MDSGNEIIQDLRLQMPYLKKHYHVKKLEIFGSQAKNLQTPESDIDLIVEFTKPVGFKFMELAEYLEKKFNRKVDLITPKGLESITAKKTRENINKEAINVA